MLSQRISLTGKLENRGSNRSSDDKAGRAGWLEEQHLRGTWPHRTRRVLSILRHAKPTDLGLMVNLLVWELGPGMAGLKPHVAKLQGFSLLELYTV